MCLFSLAEVEKDLGREILSTSCEALFLQFVTTVPIDIAENLASWRDVRFFLKSVGFKSENADLLLRPLIREFKVTGSGPWATVAYYVFWEVIAQIDSKLGSRDTPGAVFSQACWSLLESLHRIDLSARTGRVGQKVVNDTWHATKRWYSKEGKNTESLSGRDEDTPDREIPSLGQEIYNVETAIERDWAIKRLRTLVHQGSISRPDYQILLGCHLYSRSIDEMAVHLGVSYGVAKKRRQRAVKKLQKSAPHLSPNDPDSPLFPIERSSRKEVADGSEVRVPQNRK